MRAGVLNHGLAPRDSLLVLADSIFAGLYSTVPLVDWSALRRIHSLAEELTQRYPDDFESWYVLGEARFHWGSPVGSGPRQALEAFDRAILSDSSFAPAYIHPVELALRLDGPRAADRYAKGYLRLEPTDASAAGIRLADQLVEAAEAGPQATRPLLTTASLSALHYAWLTLHYAADSSESIVQVARAIAAAPAGDAGWISQPQRQLWLGISLLYRGHLRDAVDILYRNPLTFPITLVEAALLGAALPDSAARMFHGWLGGNRLMAVGSTLPWWVAQRDSAALREIARRSDSAAHSARSQVEKNVATYNSQAAQAYLALLRHDTTTALRRLEALPDSLCPLCYSQHLTLVQLLSARQENQKAARLLNRGLVDLMLPSEVLWTLERARVAERLGDREKAARDYQYVANVWRHADPELQPYVTEAREGLTRVVGEPR